MGLRGLLTGMFCAAILHGQPGTVSTVFGGYPAGDGGPAMRASLNQPGSLARDAKGNIYFMEPNRIRKISTDGIVSTVAGSGFPTGTLGDSGPARLANVNSFSNGGLEVDAEGNLLFADSNNNRIRRISPEGAITTLAGTGGRGFSGDGGAALEATLNRPTLLSAAPDGSLYFYDSNNFRIRKIDTIGRISTVAGNGINGLNGSGGNALEASITAVQGIAVDADGTIYFTVYNFRVYAELWKVSAEGVISRIAGKATQSTAGDGGKVEDATFSNPMGIRVSTDGNLLLADGTTIRRITPAGTIERVFGASQVTSNLVPLLESYTPLAGVPMSNGVWDLILDTQGGLFFSNIWVGAIFHIDSLQRIRRLAGVPVNEGADGPPQFAKATVPTDVTFDTQGNMILVDPSARIATLVPPSGPATTRGVEYFVAISVSQKGEIYSSSAVNTVNRHTFEGSNVVIAGRVQAQGGYSGDGGPATDALLLAPQGIAFDAADNLYIADQGNHRIRRVDTNGIITTFAGNGRAAFEGDKGQATNASLSFPQGVAVDENGNVYVADSGNNRVRRVDSSGVIDTIAVPASFPGAQPRRLAIAPDGSVVVTDSLHRVHRISATGSIRVIAGTGTPGFSGDGGPASLAQFFNPVGVAVDRDGAIYVADSGNQRIRRIEGASAFGASPSSMVFSFPLNSPAAVQTLSLRAGDADELTFSITTNAPWLTVTPPRGDVTPARPAALSVTANPTGMTKGRYSARITATSSRGDRYEVPVTMTISGTPQQLRLGQTGLTFVAVAGSTTPPTQSLPVLNAGTGSMPWTASVSTLSGGNWLSITPASGVTAAGSVAPSMQVTANPTGLPAGTYFGLVSVTAPSADNSPQSAVVLLSVLPTDAPPGPSLLSSGLVFLSEVGGKPNSQDIQMVNPGGRNSSVAVTLSFPTAQRWFTVAPTSANVPAGGGARVTVTPNTTGLAAGVYRGTISFRFTPDAITRTAEVLMVITTNPQGTTSREREQTAVCTPRTLQTVFRSPGGGFASTAGWPTPIELQVLDDCGRNIDSGRAVVSFSTNEPAITLSPAGNGRWTGTWAARTVRATGVGLTAQVDTDNPKLTGRTQITGGVRDNPEQPVIEKDGVVNLASQQRMDPIAVGSLVGVVGSRLAAQFREAGDGPLPQEIGDTRALVAGRPIALRGVGPGQVDAMLPVDLPDNTIHQMIIQRGRSYSPPEPVLVTSVAPAIFAADPGSTQGRIWVREPDGSQRIADGARPAHAGELIVLHAVGLGITSPAVALGQPAPDQPLATVAGVVSLTIAGKAAEVTEAALAPGLVGVYRVTATVPDGLGTSAGVPVILSVNGQDGPAVSMAVVP